MSLRRKFKFLIEPTFDLVGTVQIDFITMDGYGFDYVMVFAAETPGMMTPIATKVIRKIIAAGLRVRVHFSNSEEEIFCEIRAPVERLMRFADQVSANPRQFSACFTGRV